VRDGSLDPDDFDLDDLRFDLGFGFDLGFAPSFEARA